MQANRKPFVAGFSLVEVVLALGVIAFAITGIMGLFPVAMRTALESQRETRATLIARKIFSDLEASTPDGLLIALGTDLTSVSSFISPKPSLTNSWQHVISYDNDGLPLGNGTNSAASFLASIQCSPNTPITGLSRIQVDVMTPALAPAALRTTNTFVSLLKP